MKADSPIVKAGKMMWKLIVNANCRRASSVVSSVASVSNMNPKGVRKNAEENFVWMTQYVTLIRGANPCHFNALKRCRSEQSQTAWQRHRVNTACRGTNAFSMRTLLLRGLKGHAGCGDRQYPRHAGQAGHLEIPGQMSKKKKKKTRTKKTKRTHLEK